MWCQMTLGMNDEFEGPDLFSLAFYPGVMNANMNAGNIYIISYYFTTCQ